MKTTLNKIRKHSLCSEGWSKLLKHLGKTQADDEPLAILEILNSNGLDHALWCLQAVEGHEKEIRLFAVWCARQVQHLMKDPRSIAALDVAERYAHGQSTNDDLDAAAAAAGDVDAVWAADAAWAAVRAAPRAGDAAWAAAETAAEAAAWDAAQAGAGAWDATRAVDAAWAATWDAAWAATWYGAQAAQEKQLRKILS